MCCTYKINIEGIVQGVGFRPFVYKLAEKMQLTGQVTNQSNGVEIIVNCNEKEIDTFLESIKRNAPPLAHILSIYRKKVDHMDFHSFSIANSTTTVGITFVPPDVATCKDCERELFDNNNFRFHYLFINCTNCGPRYSIIKGLPYDRDKTTMNIFKMCEKCKEEYSDPTNRRFHAEPVCCESCGPNVYYNDYKAISAVKKIAGLIDGGFIVAVKGIGGYHLMCDAANDNALNLLRISKRRKSKPFALMCKDIATLEKYIDIADEERNLLESREAPIVIIKKQIPSISPLVNPVDCNKSAGIMLPYTPIHKLIFNFVKTPFLVATSGNIADEPICVDVKGAEKKLKIFTHHFLHHTRDIYNRVDDSVVTTVEKKIYTVRRARGLAPYPILLPKESLDVVVGLGGHLKNTLCLNIGRYAIVSQYIGDLDNIEAIDFFHETLYHLLQLHRAKTELFLVDMHPGYYTATFAANSNIPYKSVQHHLAHMASCMAENNLTDNLIGVVFDGVGLGIDGKIWGGEIFIKQGSFKRIYHLKNYKQPGGDAAARFPYRMFISYLYEEKLLFKYIDKIKQVYELDDKELILLENILTHSINTPMTSSMGRLFEGVGSLLCKIKQNEFEAHAALTLESMCIDDVDESYGFTINNNIIYIREILEGLLCDFFSINNLNMIATKFHNTVVKIILKCCENVRDLYGINDVILSGGVFQNIYLIKKSIKVLKENRFNVFFHSRIPPNDGGISLGQVYYDLMGFMYE
jgi:hydrogenase maturation protein HypF